MSAAEQLWQPKRRIGGSDIAKLLGLSSYGNAADVYLRIVEGVEAEWNPKMERGAAVEPQLRAYGQQALDLVLEDVESDYHPHPMLEFATAQIDDVALWRGLPVVVDYKSQSRWAKSWGPVESDQVPEHIRAQLAWEMLCADREMGILVVGFGDDAPPPDIFIMSHVVPYMVPRDGQFESLLVATATEFWSTHVLPRVPPSITPMGEKKKRGSK